MKAKDFFALSDEEQRSILTGVDELKMDLNVHADSMIRRRLDEVANGKSRLEEATISFIKEDPSLEIIVVKIRK